MGVLNGEEGAVGVEAGLLEEGRVAAEGEGVDGDLLVGGGEDGVHGRNVLGGLRVGDGDDEDAATEGWGSVPGGLVGVL